MNPLDQRRKRYGWFRLYNGFPSHRKWRTVALLASVDVLEVEAVAIRLLECANKGSPRGSISDFSYVECAADIGRSLDLIIRIYTAFEQIGWIDREYLTTWDKRQPDKEDPTAGERQARSREKKRAEKNSSMISAAVTRDTVTCHAQTETYTSKKEAPVDNSAIITGPITWQQREALVGRSAQRSLPLPPVEMKKGAFK